MTTNILPSSNLLGQLVEAPVVGCAGTFRVIQGAYEPEAGKVWLRECGLHITKGYEPFVIEWPIEDLRVVEA